MTREALTAYILETYLPDFHGEAICGIKRNRKCRQKRGIRIKDHIPPRVLHTTR